MGNKQIHLTKEEVLSCLKNNDYVHTFINAGFGLIGADWSIENLIEKLDNAEDIQIGGESCRAMQHGIVIFPKNAKKQSDLYFVECDDKKLSAIEKAKEQNNETN